MSKKGLKEVANADFKIGDRIFAKLKGYPYWPAKIEESPLSIKEATANKKYQIIFYGTYEINWLKADALEPYNKETIEIYGKQRKSNSFNRAMWEIENDPDFRLKRSRRDAKKDSVNYLDEQIVDNDEKQSEEDDESSKKSSSSSNESKKNKSNKRTKEKTSNDASNSKKKTSFKKNQEETRREDDSEDPKSNDVNDDVSSVDINSESNFKQEIKSTENSKRSKTVINKKKSKKRKISENKSYDSKKENEIETKSSESEMEIEASNEKTEEEKPSSNLPEIEKSLENTVRATNREKKPNKRYLHDDVDQFKKKQHRSTSQDLKSKLQDDEDVTESTEDKPPQSAEKSPETNSNGSIDILLTSKQNLKDSPSKSKAINKKNSHVKKSRLKNILNDSSTNSDEANDKEVKNNTNDKKDEKSKLMDKDVKRKIKKKAEKIKRIRIQIALFKMDFEIKKSLRVDNIDENRCCLIMQDLIKLPFTKENLFIAPEIVETIKKCRKYKNSEKIRNGASECFNKFCQMLTIDPGDLFWANFQKDREKFIKENLKKLNKEKKLANKLLLKDHQSRLQKSPPLSSS